jgi:hypothetical protein
MKMVEQHHYFLEHPFDMANIKSFIKVFEVKGIVVSVGAFHYEEYLVEKKKLTVQTCL